MNSRNPGSGKPCREDAGTKDEPLGFLIRPATPQDFAAIGAFLNPAAITGKAVRHPSFQEKRAGPELHLLALLQTKIIGRVRLRFNKAPHRSGELGIAVHRDYHRQGIGSALLLAAIAAVEKDQLADRIELHVYADNLAAISLYEKFGFEHYGPIENEVSDEATPRLLMVRDALKIRP